MPKTPRSSLAAVAVRRQEMGAWARHSGWALECRPSRIGGRRSVVLGARRKGEVVDRLLTERGLDRAALAYVGDDLLDIPALERVGHAAWSGRSWARRPAGETPPRGVRCGRCR